MTENNCTAVWFNPHQVGIYEILFEESVIAENFAGFVKRCFHEKIEELLLRKEKKDKELIKLSDLPFNHKI